MTNLKENLTIIPLSPLCPFSPWKHSKLIIMMCTYEYLVVESIADDDNNDLTSENNLTVILVAVQSHICFID